MNASCALISIALPERRLTDIATSPDRVYRFCRHALVPLLALAPPDPMDIRWFVNVLNSSDFAQQIPDDAAREIARQVSALQENETLDRDLRDILRGAMARLPDVSQERAEILEEPDAAKPRRF